MRPLPFSTVTDKGSFRDEVSKDLVKRKADVVELHQPLSDSMTDIQTSIIECMEATLSEIKRSNYAVRDFFLCLVTS